MLKGLNKFGLTIYYVADRLTEIATSNNRIMRARFCGVRLVVNPGDSVDKIVKAYKKERRERDKLKTRK